jgi:hypothetical protein
MTCYEKGVANGDVTVPIAVDTTNPPAEIEIKAHTRHNLKFYTDISGKSCDIVSVSSSHTLMLHCDVIYMMY